MIADIPLLHFRRKEKASFRTIQKQDNIKVYDCQDIAKHYLKSFKKAQKIGTENNLFRAESALFFLK